MCTIGHMLIALDGLTRLTLASERYEVSVVTMTNNALQCTCFGAFYRILTACPYTAEHQYIRHASEQVNKLIELFQSHFTCTAWAIDIDNCVGALADNNMHQQKI